MNEPLWIVVPAAGTGVRMGTDAPKQYAMLGEQCMLAHTLAQMLAVPAVDGVVVVVQQDDARWPLLAAASNPRVHSVSGGQSRAASVLCGLRHVLSEADESTWVLVHDAARPLVSLSDIQRLTDAVYNSGAVGGILATPVHDTLKRANEYHCIERSVSRQQLWQAQTPQLFRAGELFAALQTIGVSAGQTANSMHAITDESSAMEAMGHEPLLVEALQPNLKVTRPADLALATVLLAHQRSAL